MPSQPLDEDGFHSIAWDDAPAARPAQHSESSASRGYSVSSESDNGFESISPGLTGHDDGNTSAAGGSAGTIVHRPGLTVERERQHGEISGEEWGGRWMSIEVMDPVKEHEGSKEQFISYAVRTKTNLPNFTQPAAIVRRRFQDFAFLRDHLAKAFPACVVPPIPEKHRMEYIKGDRFSAEFVERRRMDLQRFADRIARHPTLQRSKLVNDFLSSTEWSVAKHHHLSHPPPDSHVSMLDSLSDTFINAFSKVRKPDGRFVEMGEGLEKFEEGLGGVERLVARNKNRVDDLAADYQDMAAAYQTLGYLESGITEPINRFAEKMLDFSTLLKHSNTTNTEPLLHAAQSLLAHSSSHRNVIKLRDQKQLDFEGLSAFLSNEVLERDRLAAIQSGHAGGPVGLGTYLRDQVDRLRGTDDIHTRRERMRKLDTKIKELQDAVETAHETSQGFSDEVLKEHQYFELNKQEEMKEMLQVYADGQVEMLKRAMEDWDRVSNEID